MSHTPRHRKVTTRKSEKRERDLAARRTRRAKREAEREGQDKRTDPDVRGGTGTTTRAGRARNLTRLERLQRGRARRTDEERRKREGRGLGGRAVRTGKPTKQASTTPPSPPGFTGDLPPLPFGPAGGSPDLPNLKLSPTEALLRGMMPRVPQGGASTGGPGDLVNAQAGLPPSPEGAPPEPPEPVEPSPVPGSKAWEKLLLSQGVEGFNRLQAFAKAMGRAAQVSLGRELTADPVSGLTITEEAAGAAEAAEQAELNRLKRVSLTSTEQAVGARRQLDVIEAAQGRTLDDVAEALPTNEIGDLSDAIDRLFTGGVSEENLSDAVQLAGTATDFLIPPAGYAFNPSTQQYEFDPSGIEDDSAEKRAQARVINRLIFSRNNLLDAIDAVPEQAQQQQEAELRERQVALAERGQAFEESQAAFVAGATGLDAAVREGRQYESRLRASIQQFDINNTGALEQQLTVPLPAAPPGIVWNASGGIFDVRPGFGGGITPEVQAWMTQMTPVYQARDRAQAMLGRIQALKIDLQAGELERSSQEAAFRAAMATNDIDSAEEARAKQILAETRLTETRNRLMPAEFIMQMLQNPVLIGLAQHMGVLAQLESIVGIKLPSVPEIAGATDTIPLPEEWNALNAIEKQLRLALFVAETGASVEDFMKQIAAQAPSAAAAPVQVETL